MDGTGWQALALIAATLMINLMVGWYLRMRRNDALKQRQQEAQKVLRAHGMEAHTYLSSFGTEAGELREALATYEFTNQIVLDREGRLVGQLLPKVKGPGLRLVVDNTKQYQGTN